MATGPILTPDQIAETKIAVGSFSGKPTPVRFPYRGQNLNIVSGHLMSKGTNVLHQTVYWQFSRELAKRIEQWLGEGVTAIFCGEGD